MPSKSRALAMVAVLAALGFGLPAARAAAIVEVVIDLRDEIAAGRFVPGRDGVGVRGAAAPLSWDRSVPASATTEPGRYALSLRFDVLPPGGQALAYKFKVDHPGQPDAGWEPGRNHALLLRDGTQQLARAYGSAPQAPPLQRTGDIERIAALPSAHVAPREVQVWLPPGYAALPQRRYPVLYLHDGQNVFDAAAAGAEWQVDETAQRLVLAGAIEPVIVVAVASSEARVDDYTPWPNGPAGGGAAAYGRYLTAELKPLIDARYRTRPGRTDTAVGGSSLGGLVSMWLLLVHPDVFGAALVVSPSVWWGGQAIVQAVARSPATLPPPRIWLDIGSAEGAAAVAGARRLRDALRERGWAPAWHEATDAGHDEAAWAARMEPMLRFLYGP